MWHLVTLTHDETIFVILISPFPLLTPVKASNFAWIRLLTNPEPPPPATAYP